MSLRLGGGSQRGRDELIGARVQLEGPGCRRRCHRLGSSTAAVVGAMGSVGFDSVYVCRHPGSERRNRARRGGMRIQPENLSRQLNTFEECLGSCFSGRKSGCAAAGAAFKRVLLAWHGMHSVAVLSRRREESTGTVRYQYQARGNPSARVGCRPATARDNFILTLQPALMPYSYEYRTFQYRTYHGAFSAGHQSYRAKHDTS